MFNSRSIIKPSPSLIHPTALFRLALLTFEPETLQSRSTDKILSPSIRKMSHAVMTWNLVVSTPPTPHDIPTDQPCQKVRVRMPRHKLAPFEHFTLDGLPVLTLNPSSPWNPDSLSCISGLFCSRLIRSRRRTPSLVKRRTCCVKSNMLGCRRAER